MITGLIILDCLLIGFLIGYRQRLVDQLSLKKNKLEITNQNLINQHQELRNRQLMREISKN